MLNSISIMGRLARDPELRSTQNGVSVLTFTIACDRDTKKDDGTRDVDFLDLAAWRQTAEFINTWFKKGDLIGITGRLQSRSYTDQNGVKRKAVEILVEHAYFAGKKASDGNESNVRTEKPVSAEDFTDYTSDDIPF